MNFFHPVIGLQWQKKWLKWKTSFKFILGKIWQPKQPLLTLFTKSFWLTASTEQKFFLQISISSEDVAGLVLTELKLEAEPQPQTKFTL